MGVKSSVMLKVGLADPGEFACLSRGVTSRSGLAPVIFSDNEHVSSLAVNFSFEVCLLSYASFVVLGLLQGGQMVSCWGLMSSSSVKVGGCTRGGGTGAWDTGEDETILEDTDWGETEAWDKARGESCTGKGGSGTGGASRTGGVGGWLCWVGAARGSA